MTVTLSNFIVPLSSKYTQPLEFVHVRVELLISAELPSIELSFSRLELLTNSLAPLFK